MTLAEIVRTSTISFAFVGAGAFASVPKVWADTATANVAVTTTVTVNCTVTTSPLTFGPYNVNDTSGLDGAGRVTLACTKGVQPTIALGAGNNSNRTMNGPGSERLIYELYQDSNRSSVWSASAPGVMTPAQAPSKAARDFTVYGRVPSGQDVSAGSYSDQVAATINF